MSRDPRDIEIDALRAPLAAASSELVELRAAHAKMTQNHTRVVDDPARVNERLTELMAALERKKWAPPVPKPPAPAPTLDVSQVAAFARPTPPELPAKPPKEKPRKPLGRRPVPDHLEAEAYFLRLDACGHCGSLALDLVDVVDEIKLRLVNEHVRRRVVERKTCRCRERGGRTTPRSPPAPWERSKVTCELLAWLLHAKFAILTPLDRLRRDLTSRGVHIAMGTLVSFIEKAADLLAPVDGVHWQKLLSGMAMDGTGIEVLVPELPKAHDGYLELFKPEHPSRRNEARTPLRVAMSRRLVGVHPPSLIGHARGTRPGPRHRPCAGVASRQGGERASPRVHGGSLWVPLVRR